MREKSEIRVIEIDFAHVSAQEGKQMIVYAQQPTHLHFVFIGILSGLFAKVYVCGFNGFPSFGASN